MRERERGGVRWRVTRTHIHAHSLMYTYIRTQTGTNPTDATVHAHGIDADMAPPVTISFRHVAERHKHRQHLLIVVEDHGWLIRGLSFCAFVSLL